MLSPHLVMKVSVPFAGIYSKDHVKLQGYVDRNMQLTS